MIALLINRDDCQIDRNFSQFQTGLLVKRNHYNACNPCKRVSNFLDFSTDPGEDLALLSACNHTIFDYGTFGLLAAFLSGGEVIQASGYSKKEHQVLSVMKTLQPDRWTFIDVRNIKSEEYSDW